MSKLTYSLLYALVWLWSLLPMPLLYLQANVMAWLLRNAFRYRRRVIRENLATAFPDKGEEERRRIERDFYRNFADVIVETVKLASISAQQLKDRVAHANPEVIPEMIAHGGGGIAVFAHFANWEWLGAGMGLQLPFPTVGVYKPLSSKAFDRLVYHLRTRLGNDMITMKQTYRESIRRLKEPCYIAFLGDQAPEPQAKMYFTRFLERPAAVQVGIATISLKLNVPLYYFDIRRVQRGRYLVTLERIPHEDLLPYSEENAHTLTERHVRVLEHIIRQDPAAWLWSHRRWKRKVTSQSTLSDTLLTP